MQNVQHRLRIALFASKKGIIMNKTSLKTAYDKAYNHFCDSIERAVKKYDRMNDNKFEANDLVVYFVIFVMYDAFGNYNFTAEEIDSIYTGSANEDTMCKFLAFYIHYTENLHTDMTGEEIKFDDAVKDSRGLHEWMLSKLEVDLSEDDIKKIHYGMSILQASKKDENSNEKDEEPSKKKLKLKKSAIAAMAIFVTSIVTFAYVLRKNKSKK